MALSSPTCWMALYSCFFVMERREQLGTGDSIHVTEELPIEWINPLARRSVTFCIGDRRSDSGVF